MSDFQEEAWEAQIGSMLAGLPDVEPPAGFIDAALDHRPLYAGRVFTGLMVLSIAALIGAMASGAVGRSQITPSVDDLATRHSSTVRAGVFGRSETDVDYRIETPVEMPDGFRRTRNIEAEDIRQAVYARGDEAASVFVQEGRVHWEALPGDGLTEIGGLTAWVDEARMVTVIEASNSVVTIVGLSSDQAAAVLQTVPRSDRSTLDRIQDTINGVTVQLGYPDLN